MDGKSPLDIELPGPLNALQLPLLKAVKGTVIEKLLEDHNIIQKKKQKKIRMKKNREEISSLFFFVAINVGFLYNRYGHATCNKSKNAEYQISKD